MASTPPVEEKKDWEDNEVVSLINSYKALPELWDNHHSMYKDRKVKNRSLNSLAQKYNTTAEEVRRKIHNLRCQFNAELRKIKRKSAEYNINEDMVYSEWKYFEQMKFLAEVYVSVQKKNDAVKYRIEAVTTNAAALIKTEEEFTSESEDDMSNDYNAITKTERILIPDNHHISKSSDDDHRIFGEYVASELRNLSVRNAKRLKLMIRKAILDVAQDEYSAETSANCTLNSF